MPEITSELRWLLDRAADAGVFIRTVLPESLDQIAQWNVPCPRWRATDVFAALRELERRDWIRFYADEGHGNEIPVREPEFDASAIVRAYRTQTQSLHYRLTQTGAAVWEEAALPNWANRYCWEISDPCPGSKTEGHCVVTANTEDIARQALLIIACDHNQLFVPGSERYTTCGRWEATYWKHFDRGVQAIAAVSCEELDFYVESRLPLATHRRLADNRRQLQWWFDPIEEPHWQFRHYIKHGGMW